MTEADQLQPAAASGEAIAAGQGRPEAGWLPTEISPATQEVRLAAAMICLASSVLSGPTYSPLTDAIGAMSHAPRHSNERTSTAGDSLAAAFIASKNLSAPRS